MPTPIRTRRRRSSARSCIPTGGYSDNVQASVLALFDAGPGAIGANVSMLLPYGDSGITHDFEESLYYELELALVPGGLGLVTSAGLGFSELGYKNIGSATGMYGSVRLDAIAQLGPSVAFSAGGYASVPLADDYANSVAAFGVRAQLELVFGRSDFYATAEVDDFTHLALFSFGFGYLHRFGG